MQAGRIYLLGFPHAEAADLCVQLGRIAPSMSVEVEEHFDSSMKLDADSLTFLWDSMLAPATLGRIFDAYPQASLVVLSTRGNADHATELMDKGAMDYRLYPCPDEVLGIYLRKAGHMGELTRQAEQRQAGGDVFITHDVATRRLLDQTALIAPSKAGVLVVGESGTGKERLARFIHQCSDRRKDPFVAINCAAIPEGMLEAELFGHEKGAFTGAVSARPGKFEMADGGTLLLDEITEMPLHLQAKLLRVLQEDEVDRLGGRQPVKIDVRVIATSNRDVVQSVAEGNFRQDLFYRLNVVTIQLPPLRSRTGDVRPLAEHFLAKFAASYGRPVPQLGREAVAALEGHDWPGNVRELENCMHRAFLMCIDGELRAEHLALVPGANPQATAETPELQAGMSIRDMERALIQQTLVHVQGNRTEAAKLLGISIRTLRNKLREYEGGTVFA